MSTDTIRDGRSFAVVDLDSGHRNKNEKLLSNVSKIELDKVLGCPKLDLRTSEPLDRGFAEAQLDSLRNEHPNRCTLVIVGGVLEDSVTSLATVALQNGFAVLVCVDLVACHDKCFREVYAQRLMQMSAILTTSRQCVYELIFNETDPQVRSRLLGALQHQSYNDQLQQPSVT